MALPDDQFAVIVATSSRMYVFVGTGKLETVFEPYTKDAQRECLNTRSPIVCNSPAKGERWMIL